MSDLLKDKVHVVIIDTAETGKKLAGVFVTEGTQDARYLATVHFMSLVNQYNAYTSSRMTQSTHRNMLRICWIEEHMVTEFAHRQSCVRRKEASIIVDRVGSFLQSDDMTYDIDNFVHNMPLQLSDLLSNQHDSDSWKELGFEFEWEE